MECFCDVSGSQPCGVHPGTQHPPPQPQAMGSGILGDSAWDGKSAFLIAQLKCWRDWHVTACLNCSCATGEPQSPDHPLAVDFSACAVDAAYNCRSRHTCICELRLE